MSVNGESLRVCTKRAMRPHAVGNSRVSAIGLLRRPTGAMAPMSVTGIVWWQVAVFAATSCTLSSDSRAFHVRIRFARQCCACDRRIAQLG